MLARSPRALLTFGFFIACTDAGSNAQGRVFGPAGSKVGLSIGEETLTAAVGAPSGGSRYGDGAFASVTALDPSTVYDVSVTSAPSGQVCSVYAGVSGTGAELSADDAVRVGCEWGFDLLGRSSDDQVLAYSNDSAAPAIGGDGRYVAFRAGEADLVPGVSGTSNVFWRDRLTGTTRLVSHAPSGGEADDNSWQPAISADGRWVVFYSSSTNLVANDTNKADDVFLWSSADDTVTRISVGPSGEEANAPSKDPTISGDGAVVAFTTYATNVAPATNDSNTNGKVVRIDLVTGERTIVTRSGKTGDPVGGAWPMLSDDGERLVFWAYSDVTGDLNPSMWDVFVYDHAKKTQWPVSQGGSGENRAQGHDSTSGIVRPAISGDGKWVTYGTSAPNVVGTTDGRWHLYLVEADQCSGAGCHAVLLDQAGGAPGDHDAASAYASLSYDGGLVAFTSAATNLGVANGDKVNVFLYARAAASLTPVTNIASGYGGAYTDAVVSARGAYVAFGAYMKLDPRFDTDGVFAAFTGRANGFSWAAP